MVTYSQAYQEELRREIRDIKARDPVITYAAITEKLNDLHNHSFDQRYIAKLAKKVEGQLRTEIDRAQVEDRLSGIRENYRAMRQRLSEIVYWNADDHPGERKPANKDVIEAAKNIVMLDLAVFNAELANGLYKRPIEEIAKTFHYEPLSGEVRVAVIAAWSRGGLLPAAVIEQMVPALPVYANTDTGTA